MQKAGVKSASVMKAVSKRIGQEVKDAAIKAGNAAKKAGKGAKGQLDAAIKGAKGVGKKAGKEGGEGVAKGVDDAIETAGKNAQKGTKFKPKLSTVAKGTAGATILYAGWGAMGAIDDLLGGDGLFAGLTGENCPDKVEDRGIDEEEDPDAYEEAIQECQEEAEKKALMVMGVTAAVICGVIYVVFLR